MRPTVRTASRTAPKRTLTAAAQTAFRASTEGSAFVPVTAQAVSAQAASVSLGRLAWFLRTPLRVLAMVCATLNGKTVPLAPIAHVQAARVAFRPALFGPVLHT